VDLAHRAAAAAADGADDAAVERRGWIGCRWRRREMTVTFGVDIFRIWVPGMGTADVAKSRRLRRPSPDPVLARSRCVQAACGMSEKKAAQDPSATLVLGFTAGALIGIGALLMTCVGGASPALAG
jgi:hypothetical protein